MRGRGSIEPDDGYCQDMDYNNRSWEDWEREAEERARRTHPGLWEFIETLAQGLPENHLKGRG